MVIGSMGCDFQLLKSLIKALLVAPDWVPVMSPSVAEGCKGK